MAGIRGSPKIAAADLRRRICCENLASYAPPHVGGYRASGIFGYRLSFEREQRGFGGVYLFVRSGIVAIPKEKQRGPDNSEQAKEEKRHAPGDVLEAGIDQQRREGAAKAGAHPHDALSAGTFTQRKPATEGLGQIRKGPCLARAKQKPGDDQ